MTIRRTCRGRGAAVGQQQQQQRQRQHLLHSEASGITQAALTAYLDMLSACCCSSAGYQAQLVQYMALKCVAGHLRESPLSTQSAVASINVPWKALPRGGLVRARSDAVSKCVTDIIKNKEPTSSSQFANASTTYTRSQVFRKSTAASLFARNVLQSRRHTAQSSQLQRLASCPAANMLHIHLSNQQRKCVMHSSCCNATTIQTTNRFYSQLAAVGCCCSRASV